MPIVVFIIVLVCFLGCLIGVTISVFHAIFREDFFLYLIGGGFMYDFKECSIMTGYFVLVLTSIVAAGIGIWWIPTRMCAVFKTWIKPHLYGAIWIFVLIFSIVLIWWASCTDRYVGPAEIEKGDKPVLIREDLPIPQGKCVCEFDKQNRSLRDNSEIEGIVDAACFSQRGHWRSVIRSCPNMRIYPVLIRGRWAKVEFRLAGGDWTAGVLYKFRSGWSLMCDGYECIDDCDRENPSLIIDGMRIPENIRRGGIDAH